jgi:hypothetical protein
MDEWADFGKASGCSQKDQPEKLHTGGIVSGKGLKPGEYTYSTPSSRFQNHNCSIISISI